MFNNDKIDIIVKKIEIIEEHQKLCNLRHSQHDEIHVKQEEHHRRLDDKIEKSLEYQRSTDETVKSILTVMIENLPTFKRSKDFYTTVDTLRTWAVWVGSVGGAASLLYAFLHFMGVL